MDRPLIYRLTAISVLPCTFLTVSPLHKPYMVASLSCPSPLERGWGEVYRFEKAVEKALQASEAKSEGRINYKLQIVPSKEMPELSVIDYLMWAVQRKF